MKDKSKKVIIILLFILIITTQIIAIVFATSKREYYHIDEYYSHGLMQYKRAFIFENEDFLDTWHDSNYYKDYLAINENEKFDFSSVYSNQVEDVHPPLYYLLLRIACSFNIEKFSIWPGTILNIIISIIANIFLFLIAKEIFKSSYYALLICTITGFSLASIETVMYVRMYELLILNILMLIYWHIQKSKMENLTFKDMIPLYFIVLIGFLTHYYYLIILIVLFIMYVVRYIKQRKTKNSIKYTTTLIASGITGILIFPYAVKHIFFSYRGNEVTNNFFNFSNLLYKIQENIVIINHEIFNSLGYIIIGVILAVSIIWVIYKKDNNKEHEKNLNIGYATIPMTIYLIISIIASPYEDLRYLMPAIPLMFLSIIYIIKDLLQDILNKKHTFYIISIICIIFSILVIPKLSNNTYSYAGHKEVLKYVEENLSKKPMIYIYDDLSVQYNKTMEMYEILTKVDKSYIISTDEVSINKLKNALKQVNSSEGFTVILNGIYANSVLDSLYKNGMITTFNYIGCLGNNGRFVIYELK